MKRRRVLRVLVVAAGVDLVALVAVAGSGRLADRWGVAHADDRVALLVIVMLVTYLLVTYTMRIPRSRGRVADATVR